MFILLHRCLFPHHPDSQENQTRTEGNFQDSPTEESEGEVERKSEKGRDRGRRREVLFSLVYVIFVTSVKVRKKQLLN